MAHQRPDDKCRVVFEMAKKTDGTSTVRASKAQDVMAVRRPGEGSVPLQWTLVNETGRIISVDLHFTGQNPGPNYPARAWAGGSANNIQDGNRRVLTRQVPHNENPGVYDYVFDVTIEGTLTRLSEDDPWVIIF